MQIMMEMVMVQEALFALVIIQDMLIIQATVAIPMLMLTQDKLNTSPLPILVLGFFLLTTIATAKRKSNTLQLLLRHVEVCV
jgi:hypothetical protein